MTRALLVEDHPVLGPLLRDRLAQKLPTQLITRVSERDRIEGKPVIAFVDYDLPDGKGDAVVRHLLRLSPDCFVVAISARDEGNEQLQRAGAREVCAKTGVVRMDELVDNVVSR